MSKTATLDDLKSLRLYGMVTAWTDLIAQGESSIASSKWLIDHLLDAEETDRSKRSVRHQLSAAKLPIHRNLTGFDFSAAKVDENLVNTLQKEKREGRSGRLVESLLRMDLVILDELGYLPFSQAGGALLFQSPGQALRAHQRDDYHQPELLGIVVGLCRRQDDHGIAEPPHPPLPYA
jgi:DNA replication protein DnaC